MANTRQNPTPITKKLVVILGLDLLPYAVGFLKFVANAPFQPTKFKEIKNQVGDLTDDKIDDALSFCKEMLDSENDRGDRIESKAYNILGVTGISTAFITGVTSLLSDKASPIHIWLTLIVYFLIVFALTITVLLASRVVIVGDYKYSYPDISDVFNMGTQDLLETKKERLASYLFSYSKNLQIHNQKASYLTASQIWFRNAIILFLVLSVALAFAVVQDSNNSIVHPTNLTTTTLTIIVSPTQVLTQTSTPTTMQATKTSSPTTQPTYTPAPTTHRATFTPTSP